MTSTALEPEYPIPEFDPSTGWLVPGRVDIELKELFVLFVEGREDDRRVETWAAINLLLDCVKQLIPSGFLMIGGTFVSNQPGPCDRPSIAVVPHDASTLTSWHDAEEERFTGYVSLHDVTIGSLSSAYVPVLHPLSGLLEVLYCDPSDAEQVAGMMGAVTLANGRDVLGVRGVLEVEW